MDRRTVWKDGKWVLLLDGQERSDEFAAYVAGLENKAEAIKPIMQELEEAAQKDVDLQNRLNEALEKERKLSLEREKLHNGMFEFSLRKTIRRYEEENEKLRRILPYFADALKSSETVNDLLQRYNSVTRRKGMPWRKLFRDTEIFLEELASWNR